MHKHPYHSVTPVAESIPFDKDNAPDCEFTSEDIQAVIEELCRRAATSASPGFTFGRSGALPPSTFLLADNNPSNITGRIVLLDNARIRKIFTGNQDADIIKFGIYTHDGDNTNLTLIGTVTTTATRTNVFDVNIAVDKGKQIALRIEADSPNSGKTSGAGFVLTGTL